MCFENKHFLLEFIYSRTFVISVGLLQNTPRKNKALTEFTQESLSYETFRESVRSLLRNKKFTVNLI